MARTKSTRTNSQNQRNGNDGGSGASTSRGGGPHATGSRRSKSNRASNTHATDDNMPSSAYTGTGPTPYDPSDPENTGAMGEYNNFLLSYGLKPYEVDEASAIMDALADADRKSERRKSGRGRR